METERRNVADDVVRVIAPSLVDHLIIVLPDGEDPRLRIAHQACEARIWKHNLGYRFEILSLGVMIAEGEAASAPEALERTITLTLLLARDRRGAA